MSELIILDTGMTPNGVTMTFSETSNAGVKWVLHFFLIKLLKTWMEDINDRSKGYYLHTVHISSTSEPYREHKIGGPHRSGLAVDISAINGKNITKFYNVDPEVRGICDSLQYSALNYSEVFENFGPLICFKSKPDGEIYQIKYDQKLINAHKSHLHFSVRG